MSSKPAPAVIAVGVIRAGAPTISSAFEVVREEALPSKSPRRPALRPERRPFPKISTNNDQLMMAIRVCRGPGAPGADGARAEQGESHFGVAQAIPLFTTRPSRIHEAGALRRERTLLRRVEAVLGGLVDRCRLVAGCEPAMTSEKPGRALAAACAPGPEGTWLVTDFEHTDYVKSDGEEIRTYTMDQSEVFSATDRPWWSTVGTLVMRIGTMSGMIRVVLIQDGARFRGGSISSSTPCMEIGSPVTQI